MSVELAISFFNDETLAKCIFKKRRQKKLQKIAGLKILKNFFAGKFFLSVFEWLALHERSIATVICNYLEVSMSRNNLGTAPMRKLFRWEVKRILLVSSHTVFFGWTYLTII